MKQSITFTRTETVTLELDYLVDPWTRGNAEALAAQAVVTMPPVGRAGFQPVTASAATAWTVKRAVPDCCACPNKQGKSKAKKR